MIIPIRAPANNADDESTEKVEWVMLELNGELLKPLDEENRREANIINEDDIKRRVELGSVKFDSDVSCVLSCLFETLCTYEKHILYRHLDIPKIFLLS